MHGIKDQVPPTGTPEWCALFWEAYGAPGFVALAYTLACRHGHAMRHHYGAMPFLTITGHAGSGKTTLLRTLAAVTGWPNGFPSHTRSTHAARMRVLMRPGISTSPLLVCAAELPSVVKQYYDRNRVATYAVTRPNVSGETIDIPAPGGVILECDPHDDIPAAFLARSAVIQLRPTKTDASADAVAALLRSTPWPHEVTETDFRYAMSVGWVGPGANPESVVKAFATLIDDRVPPAHATDFVEYLTNL